MTILATLYTGNTLQNFYFKNFVSEEICHAISHFTSSYPERYAKMFLIDETSSGEKKLAIRSVKDERIEIYIDGDLVESPITIYENTLLLVIDRKVDKQFQLVLSKIEEISAPMKLYKINKDVISVGRDPQNVISFPNNLEISRTHANIHVQTEAFVEDKDSKHGVYVNGKRVQGKMSLAFGDTIQILNIRFVYMNDFIAINTERSTSVKLTEVKSLDQQLKKVNKKIERQFSPSARIIEQLIEEEVTIDLPPPPSNHKEMPLLYTIGPSATMAFAMLGTLLYNFNSGNSNPSSFFMAGALLLGAFLWPSLSRSYQQKQRTKAEEERVVKYRNYLEKEKEKINKKLGINYSILNNHLYPNVDRIMSYAEEGSRKDFWSKASSHQDFLEVRLGTGKRPSTINLNSSRQGFTLTDDPILEDLNVMLEQYKYMNDAPLTYSLQNSQLIGVTGSVKNNIEFINTTLLNIVGLHHYEDVKVVLIYNEQSTESFEWAFGMPHLWNNEKSMRFTASNKREFQTLFTYLTEVFIEREGSDESFSLEAKVHKPRYVFVVTDPTLIENEPFIKNLYNANNQLSISTIVTVQNPENLPRDCDLLVEANDQNYYMYSNNSKVRNELLSINKEATSLEKLKQYSQTVLNINVKKEAATAEIPTKVGFLEIYSAGQFDSLGIENLWLASKPYESLKVPIGYGAGGTLFSLDIHEKFHGPHGLVAGTTGSGKSEFLQSYIISAAINYHPHDLAFVLIDYKGGGMANIFDDLPHLAGKITNLSGNMLQRSLNSIEAELKKRQRYFTEFGVNHIDKYQELFKEGVAKEPLPHLVLIADEFAQLKSQQREFMAKLIDIAQIGRSLGVHLILATQKPAGLVDEQIWGNTRFRVCLKVADKRDSNEMIRKPDAALIKLPGRCYVQVGYDEIYEQIQSAYSGLNYEPLETFIDPNEITVKLTDKTATILKEEMKEIEKLPPVLKNGKPISQLEGLIQYIANIQVKRNIAAYKLWLPPLSNEIYLHELDGFVQFDGTWQEQEGLNIVFAMGDYTNTQLQKPVVLNLLKDGHTRIHGASTTGKTTTLQTILFSLMSKYSPKDVQIYMFDLISEASRYYKAFPHCVDVITASDPLDVSEAMENISEIIEARKAKFAKVYANTLEEYKEKTGEHLPNIVIAIDGLEQLKIVSELTTVVGQIASLLNISRAYGVYFVVTATTGDSIHYSIRDAMANVFSLQQNETQHYRDVLGKTITITPDTEKGRGLHIYDNELWEMQVALIAENRDAEKPTKMKDLTVVAQQMTEQAQKGNLVTETATASVKKDKLIQQEQPSQVAIASAVATATKPKTLRLKNMNEQFAIGNKYKKAEEQLIDFESLTKFSIIGSRESEMKVHVKFMLDQLLSSQSKVFLVDSNGWYNELAQNVHYFAAEESSLSAFVEALNEAIKSAEQNSLLGMDAQESFVVINGFIKLYDAITDDDIAILEGLIVKAQSLNIHFITVETNLVSLGMYTGTALYMYTIHNSNGLYYEYSINNQGYFITNLASADTKYTCRNGEVYAFVKQEYGLIQNPYREEV